MKNNWRFKNKILNYINKRVEPCSPCMWECCHAEVCHRHYEDSCRRKPWFVIFRIALFIDDILFRIKHQLPLFDKNTG